MTSMGPKRTFNTEAERAAYITGYHDAINTAATVLKGGAALAHLAVSDDVLPAVTGALTGVAATLEDHARGVV